jgi:predicted lactoylglutathione lyase
MTTQIFVNLPVKDLNKSAAILILKIPRKK